MKWEKAEREWRKRGGGGRKGKRGGWNKEEWRVITSTEKEGEGQGEGGEGR